MQMGDDLLVGSKYEGAGARCYTSKMLNVTDEAPMKYSQLNSIFFAEK